MNKAFVREPDDDGRGRCPRCDGVGTAVRAAVLDAHVRPEARSKLQDEAWFCESPACELAYFNWFGGVVLAAELLAPVYPKSFDAPLCACFGLTLADVQRDLDEGAPTRVRALLAKAKSPEARCAVLAANGQCCVKEVQREYVRGLQS